MAYISRILACYDSYWVKFAYSIIGIGFLVIFGALYFFAPDTTDDPSNAPPMEESFSLSSPVFDDGGVIPSRYTCDAENVSPPLVFKNVPEGTVSLALVMDDPDVPKQIRPDGVFDHLVLYGIDPKTTEIAEGTLAGASGLNGRGSEGYLGPCPPKDYTPSEHRYFFRLYALEASINFITAPTKAELLSAIEPHIIAEAVLMGRYERK